MLAIDHVHKIANLLIHTLFIITSIAAMADILLDHPQPAPIEMRMPILHNIDEQLE